MLSTHYNNVFQPKNRHHLIGNKAAKGDSTQAIYSHSPILFLPHIIILARYCPRTLLVSAAADITNKFAYDGCWRCGDKM